MALMKQNLDSSQKGVGDKVGKEQNGDKLETIAKKTKMSVQTLATLLSYLF